MQIKKNEKNEKVWSQNDNEDAQEVSLSQTIANQ